MDEDVKFPNVTVQLLGQDSNAFMIMGLVQRAMRKEGVPAADIKAYMEEAMKGDYDHLLRLTMRTVNVT